MPIPFSCPHCGASMTVADHYAGQSGPCATCGQTITIPGGAFGSGFSAPAPQMSPQVAPYVPPYSPPYGQSAPAKSSGGGGMSILMIILGIGGVALLACGGVLAMLIIPAVKSAREAAHRVNCQNHLKQLALAMHNYHDVYQSFPPQYTVDSQGRPLHSWRTLLLPYLEGNALYGQIRLDEPWDSPHNRTIGAQMPTIFRCPTDDDPASTMTSYVAVAGVGTIWEGKRHMRMYDITDGTSNTMMFMETKGAGVHWMEPRDLDLSAFTSMVEVPSNHPKVLNVALCDGSVYGIQLDTLDTPKRQAMATRAGGEVISLP